MNFKEMKLKLIDEIEVGDFSREQISDFVEKIFEYPGGYERYMLWYITNNCSVCFKKTYSYFKQCIETEKMEFVMLKEGYKKV